MMEPVRIRRRRMANKSVGLLLASTALLCAGNLRLAGAACEDLEAACGDDEVCLGCLAYTQTAEDINTSACVERYPGIWSIGGEGYTAAFCDSAGGRYCCDFEDNTAAETCMDNTVAASYWSCLMDDVGCEVGDMPCYTGAEILPVVSTNSTPAPSMPTDEPTPYPSMYSSVVTTAPSSNSSSSSTSSVTCEDELAECENDATCVECAASTSATHDSYSTECEVRYPNNFIYASEGGSNSYCSTQGAYFCCEFETEVFAETCMQNAATASYWNCLIVGAGCSVDDMPCYTGIVVNPGGNASTPAPTSASTTLAPVVVATNTPAPASSSDGSNESLDVTPSPSATGSPTDAGDATAGADANSNGAARVGASSRVLAVGCAVCLLTAFA